MSKSKEYLEQTYSLFAIMEKYDVSLFVFM